MVRNNHSVQRRRRIKWPLAHRDRGNMNNTPRGGRVRYTWIHDCTATGTQQQTVYDAYAAGRPGYPSARRNGLARCLPYAVSFGGRPTTNLRRRARSPARFLACKRTQWRGSCRPAARRPRAPRPLVHPVRSRRARARPAPSRGQHVS